MSNKTTLKSLLDQINLDHFYNGWTMWPAWWNESTPSWQLGFKARAHAEKLELKRSKSDVKTISEDIE